MLIFFVFCQQSIVALSKSRKNYFEPKVMVALRTIFVGFIGVRVQDKIGLYSENSC